MGRGGGQGGARCGAAARYRVVLLQRGDAPRPRRLRHVRPSQMKRYARNLSRVFDCHRLCDTLFIRLEKNTKRYDHIPPGVVADEDAFSRSVSAIPRTERSLGRVTPRRGVP